MQASENVAAARIERLESNGSRQSLCVPQEKGLQSNSVALEVSNHFRGTIFEVSLFEAAFARGSLI